VVLKNIKSIWLVFNLPSHTVNTPTLEGHVQLDTTLKKWVV